eukprot:14076581-Ditylum_brightwellii.AAC.1
MLDFITSFRAFKISSVENLSGNLLVCALSHASIAIKKWSTSMFVHIAVASDVKMVVAFSTGEIDSSFFLKSNESLMKE